MTEDTEGESDGLDDAEFTDEHDKYLENVQRRSAELCRLEEERQSVASIPKMC